MKFLIETDRLILREIIQEDAQDMFLMDSNPHVHRYLGQNPVSHIDQIHKVILMVQKQYEDNGIGRFAIIEKKTNQFIGWTGLKLVREMINNKTNYYDLGYRLKEAYWGRGIATESAIASLDYGFNIMGLEEIYSMCEVGNISSANVIEKCGFNYIETINYDGNQHYWFRLTKADWHDRKI